MHLTDEEFQWVVSSLTSLFNNAASVEQIKQKVKRPISRQTINRYHLLIGDYLFAKYLQEEMDGMGRIWPLSLYGVYRALYEHQRPVDKNERPKLAMFVKHVQSNQINVLGFEVLRQQSKNRRGIPLQRMPSWWGMIQHRLLMHVKKTKDGDSRELHNYCLDDLLNELYYDPINPKELRSYRLFEQNEGILVKEFRGTKLDKTWEVPFFEEAF